jgi:hypothetical protein
MSFVRPRLGKTAAQTLDTEQRGLHVLQAPYSTADRWPACRTTQRTCPGLRPIEAACNKITAPWVARTAPAKVGGNSELVTPMAACSAPREAL